MTYNSSKLQEQLGSVAADLCNTEAEALVLGGILFDPKAISRIGHALLPEHFYPKAHQEIYQAALELYQQQEPTDIVTVSDRLQDKKQLEKNGGIL